MTPLFCEDLIVSASSPVRALDKLAANGITAYSARRIAPGKLKIRVKCKETAKIFAIFRGSCYTVTKAGPARLAKLRARALRRPGIRYEMIAKVIGRGEGVTPTMALRIETEIRYAGYIAREQRVIKEVQRHENVAIPPDFDYAPLSTLTLEAREKLARIRPRTLAQAGRIPGVSPSDLSQLSLALLKAGRGE